MKKIPSQTEKKMIYGIRSLKNGTGSVLIGASIVLLSATMPTISANENLPQTQENTSAVIKAPTETETSQTQKETPISEQKNANASLDTKKDAPATDAVLASETPKKEAPAVETTTAPETPKIEDATTSQANSKEEKVDASTSAPSSDQKPQADTSSEEPIEDNYFRIHVKKLPEENKDSQGLWTWDDVEKPSENWPNGAKSFKDAKQDDYGYYLDVKLKNEQAKKVSFLINNTKGDNLTGDRSVERLSPKMNEAWLDENYKVYNYRPQPAGTVRVNYYRTDGNYDKKSLWYWGDVKNPSSGEWPDGTDFTATGKHGRYIDIPLNEAAREFGFLLLDESKKGDDVKIRKEDYKFTDLKNHSQIFLKDDDETIYTNPYYVHDIRMTGAQHVAKSRIESSFSTLVGAKKDDILKHSGITDYQGNKVAITDVEVDEAGKKVTYIGDFSDTQHPYTVSYNSDRFTTRSSWRLKDETYSYDGPLGATLKEDGKRVDLTLWSPSADKVSVVVYDKKDPEKVVGTVPLEKGEKGISLENFAKLLIVIGVEWNDFVLAYANKGGDCLELPAIEFGKHVVHEEDILTYIEEYEKLFDVYLKDNPLQAEMIFKSIKLRHYPTISKSPETIARIQNIIKHLMKSDVFNSIELEIYRVIVNHCPMELIDHMTKQLLLMYKESANTDTYIRILNALTFSAKYFSELGYYQKADDIIKKIKSNI